MTQQCHDTNASKIKDAKIRQSGKKTFLLGSFHISKIWFIYSNSCQEFLYFDWYNKSNSR